jgi:hypothetical protein
VAVSICFSPIRSKAWLHLKTADEVFFYLHTYYSLVTAIPMEI